MPDKFTQVTTRGYGSRIGSSIGAAIAGIVMFFGSFVLLYWNEGRADLADIAVDAVVAEPTTDVADGTFVSMHGTFTGDQKLGDDLYLDDGAYLAIDRDVEMYAWVEETEEESSTNLGGSETTTKTYNYVKEWTTNPKDEGEFTYPEGHENPSMIVEGEEFRAAEITIGSYTIDGADVELPTGDAVALSKENVTVASGAKIASEEYVFLGSGTLSEPKVGDLRVSYTVVPSGIEGTVFGEVDGSTVIAYVNDDGDEVFRIFEGTRDQAIATLHDEYVIMMWVMRAVGFLLMWLGLTSVIGPIATLLDVLPFLGRTTRFLAGLVMLPVAFVLSAVTIIVSMIAHNLVALVVVVGLLVGLTLFLLKRRAATMSVKR